jgi:hypothetical protein
MLTQSNEERAEELMKKANKDVKRTWKIYHDLAQQDYSLPKLEEEKKEA